MSTYRFAAQSSLTINNPGAGGDIPAGHLVAMTLETFKVDPENFISHDWPGADREGIVLIRINGQSTPIAFSGKTEQDTATKVKYADKLVYLGLCPGRLAYSVNILESDAEVRDALETTAKGSEWIGKSALAGMHPAVGPGAALFASILRLVKESVDDDQEYQGFFVQDGAFKNGQTWRLFFESKEGIVLEIVFNLVDLGQVASGKLLSLRIKNIRADIQNQTIRIRRFHGVNASRPTASNFEPAEIGSTEWLKEAGCKWFNCEALSGKKTFAYTCRIADAESTVTWENAELFVLTAAERSDKGSLVPLTLNFSVNPKQLKAEAILGLVPQALAVAQAAGAETKDVAAIVEKVTPGAVGLLSEITEWNLALFNFNGVLVLDPPGGNILPQALPGVITMPSVGGGRWQVDIPAKDIEWRGRKIGTFSFTLEARVVG